jgi:hypothetical protein
MRKVKTHAKPQRRKEKTKIGIATKEHKDRKKGRCPDIFTSQGQEAWKQQAIGLTLGIRCQQRNGSSAQAPVNGEVRI